MKNKGGGVVYAPSAKQGIAPIFFFKPCIEHKMSKSCSKLTKGNKKLICKCPTLAALIWT